MLGLFSPLARWPVGPLARWPVGPLARLPLPAPRLRQAGVCPFKPANRRTGQPANGITGQPANRVTGQPANRPNRLGRSTLELAVLIVVVAGALVGMSTYLRRAYQGYARTAVSGQSVPFDPTQPFGSSAPSQEFQFDPTQPYREAFQLSNVSLGQDIQILTGQAAVDLFAGDPLIPLIRNIPGGTLPGRVLATKVHVVNSFDFHKDAHYEAK